MNTVCIMCPVGCQLEIEEREGKVLVSGNSCRRGVDYGVQEFADPKRVVTGLAPLRSGGVVPVKTNGQVNKHDVAKVLELIKSLRLDLPVNAGDVVIKDALGSGTDIVATDSRP